MMAGKAPAVSGYDICTIKNVTQIHKSPEPRRLQTQYLERWSGTGVKEALHSVMTFSLSY